MHSRDGFRVICGGDTGHRDYVWMQRMVDKILTQVEFVDQTEQIATLGLWGPEARATLQKLMDDPDSVSRENFPATAKEINVRRRSGPSVSRMSASKVGSCTLSATASHYGMLYSSCA